MCVNLLCIIILTRIWDSKHTKGNASHFLQKKQRKIDFDLQRKTKIYLKKNGKIMCLVTNHQCICFINKIEKMTLFGEARKIKFMLPKRFKRARM